MEETILLPNNSKSLTYEAQIVIDGISLVPYLLILSHCFKLRTVSLEKQ